MLHAFQSLAISDVVWFTRMHRERWLVSRLGPGRQNIEGNADLLRQRLQEILRSVRAANVRAKSLHEEGWPELIAGMR
jgi:hypothetical protein